MIHIKNSKVYCNNSDVGLPMYTLRELKNLDCSISPVKCQRRRGELGLKRIFPFPLKFIRGVGLLGVLFWQVLFWEPFCIYCWVFSLGC
jgi:hypothetical protein